MDRKLKELRTMRELIGRINAIKWSITVFGENEKDLRILGIYQKRYNKILEEMKGF